MKRKEALDMNETCVSFIGHNLSDLSILTRIDLSKCLSLTLHNNLLKNLHGIPVLDRLTELNLSSNQITDCKLPELSHMPFLVRLDLSANHLQSIQFYPSRLPSLEVLSVAYNSITTIQGLDFSLPNLIHLDICGNMIDNLDEILGALSGFVRLQSLSIKGNPVCPNIAKVSDIFTFCPSLQVIDEHPCAEWMNAERTMVFTPRFDRVRNEILAQLESQRAFQQQQLLEAQQHAPVALFTSPVKQPQHPQHAPLTPWSPEPLPAETKEPVVDETAGNNLKKYLILSRYLRQGSEAEFQSLNMFFQTWKALSSANRTAAKESQWRSEREDLLAQHSVEVSLLKGRIEAAEKEKSDASAAVVKVESVTADLQSQLAALKHDSEAALLEATRQLDKQWKIVEANLINERTVLLAENAQLKEEVERCGASVESIEAMTSVLKEQLRLHQSNEQHLEQRHSVVQNEVAALKEANRVSEEKAATLSSENATLQAALNLQKDANKTLQDSLTASEVCREALKIEFQTFKTQSLVQQQNNSMESAKREEEAVIQQLRLDKANLTDTVSKLETRLMKMHAAMEQLKLQHTDALLQQTDLIEKQQREEKKCVDLLNDCRKLQEVAEVYKGEAHKATKYKKQLNTTKEQLEEMTERWKKAEASANEWRDKSVNANVMVDQLKDTLREVQHTVKDLQLDNERLANTNKNGMSMQEDLQTKLTVKDKIIDDKMHLVDELKKKLTQASADLITLRNSCLELENRLIASSEELAVRDKQLEAKTFSNNRLKTILLELHRSNSEPVGGGGDIVDRGLPLSASDEDDESLFLMLEKANSRMMQGRRNVMSGGGGSGGSTTIAPVDASKAFQGLDLSASIDFS